MNQLQTTSDTDIRVISDLEIVMTRTFDAPRELVYQACTQAKHMAQWWGPRGYALPVCEMDVRPGGAYRFIQRGTDGGEHVFYGVFREVAPPRHLVMTQVYEPYADHEVVVSIDFEELPDNRTRLNEHMLFDTVESRDGMLAAGMEYGARESMDRLAEQLQVMERGILVERIFNAPRELVFDVWTKPEHVAQWWGPNGFTNTIQQMDVRAGGVWRFIMHGPDGVDYPNNITFVEVVRPERLVYDHAGNKPGEADFRGVVTFEDDGGRTRVTMRNLFPSAAIREMIIREYHAEEGANQTLDRLGAYVERLPSSS
jgi:uncharacterized protein YndB with AHSA1/START domain